jgi:hypothetical protein
MASFTNEFKYQILKIKYLPAESIIEIFCKMYFLW